MSDLIHCHWFPLTSQGNIYSLTCLQSRKRLNKVLVALLKRKIYSFECQLDTKSCIVPLVKELYFSYIPSTAEIISIDAYNKSEVGDEFVIGITITKPSGECSVEKYLNIYTSIIDNDGNSVESIAQNCCMVELSFMPYLLYHTILPQDTENEIIWLLSGNDCKIHIIREDKQNRCYAEYQIKKYFPELDEIKAIALWIDVYYYDNFQWRYTAVCCENGLFKLAKVNVKTLEIVESWVLRYDNPICSVRIFQSQNYVKIPDFLNINCGLPKDDGILNVVIASENTAVLFQDICRQGMSSDVMLCTNDTSLDCILCSCIADINMDGQNEILLGTYSNELLIFSQVNNVWKLIHKKLFDAPVHSISYMDLIGDGVKALTVLTQRSVHILQHDPKETGKKWEANFAKLLSVMNIEAV